MHYTEGEPRALGGAKDKKLSQPGGAVPAFLGRLHPSPHPKVVMGREIVTFWALCFGRRLLHRNLQH